MVQGVYGDVQYLLVFGTHASAKELRMFYGSLGNIPLSCKH